MRTRRIGPNAPPSRMLAGVMLGGALAACGGASAASDATVPQPVAVAPEATAPAARPAPGTRPQPPGEEGEGGEEVRAGQGREAGRQGAPAPEPAPSEPADEQDSGGARGGLVGGFSVSTSLDLFHGSRAAPVRITDDIRWWARVTAPGGTERRLDVFEESLATAVAGWSCRVGRARSSRSIHITRGARSEELQEERELVCERREQRRSGVARCRITDDGSGSPPQRTISPAELDLPGPGGTHRITLGCDIR